MLLAGDVGGTKTNLGIYSTEKGPRKPIIEATFPSGQYQGLEMIVREFLARASLKVNRASFGVAGPVVGSQAKITNLPWLLNETQLREVLNLTSVSLLNDLEAIAYGVPLLEPGDLHTLNEGTPIPHGTLAVIAPGTGLGEAFLTWDGLRYRAHPSEGGHSDFGPTNPLELNLLRYVHEKMGHVSYERICSGPMQRNPPGWLSSLLVQMIPLLLLWTLRLTARSHVSSVQPQCVSSYLSLGQRRQIWRSRCLQLGESTSAEAFRRTLYLPWRVGNLWRASHARGGFLSWYPAYRYMLFSTARSRSWALHSTVWNYPSDDSTR